MKELILGGARSGKSRLAEERAIGTGKKLFYIATAYVGDEEMHQRIEHHKGRRNNQWKVIEEYIELGTVLSSIDDAEHAIVIDCLTLWVSNGLHEERFNEEREKLCNILPRLKADIFMVSNEVGSGIVPLGTLSREFVDQSGWLHQHLATICERVTLVVAGLPLKLKD